MNNKIDTILWNRALTTKLVKYKTIVECVVTYEA